MKGLSPASVLILRLAIPCLALGGAATASAQPFEEPQSLTEPVVAGTPPMHGGFEVRTDGAGTWIGVWQSDDSLGGSIGTDNDILFARSTDAGANWSAPMPLNANAATDTGGDGQPSLATDGAGHWVVVWVSDENLGGGIGTDTDIFVSESSDNGLTWSPPAVLNSNAALDSSWHGDGSPAIATDGSGNWVVTWTGFTTGAPLGESRDLFVARSTDNGASWTARAALESNTSTDDGGVGTPSITTDGAGNWVTVWYASAVDFGDFNILVSRSTNNGATWSVPVPLQSNAASDQGDERAPNVVTDKSGLWITVWQSNDPTSAGVGKDTDILVARSTDNGVTWTDPAPLNGTAATDFSGGYTPSGDYNPRIATDGAGVWMAVWLAQWSLGGRTDYDTDIMASRSTDGGVSWSPPRAIYANARTDLRSDYDPAIATDGAGNWVAGWAAAELEFYGGQPGVGTEWNILVARGAPCEAPPPGGPACAAAPLDACWCLRSTSSKLDIRDSSDPSKDKLKWLWKGGENFTSASLGTPTADTGYALCVYDTSASIPVLRASIEVSPSGSLWISRESKGFSYSDKSGTSAGVQKLSLKTGDWGRSSVSVSAAGANLPLPASAGGTFFQQDPQVVVQLVSSDHVCWTTEFDVENNRKHEANAIKTQVIDRFVPPKPD